MFTLKQTESSTEPNGVEKPVLNVFRMFSKMSGETLDVHSDHAVPLEAMLETGVRERPDVTALATLDHQRLCIIVWHYHDDDLPGPSASVELALSGLPATTRATLLEHYRIDQEHSNAFTAWQRMGSPQSPTSSEYDQLLTAGRLATLGSPSQVSVENGQAKLSFPLPRQAVSLLVLEWAD